MSALTFSPLSLLLVIALCRSVQQRFIYGGEGREEYVKKLGHVQGLRDPRRIVMRCS